MRPARALWRKLILTAGFCMFAIATCASRAVADADVQDRLLPVEVTINSTPGGNWVLLERNGVLHAPADAFDEWRLTRGSDAVGISYRDQNWYPLSSVPGFEERRNPVNQSVDLVFSASQFAATRLNSENIAQRPAVTASLPALFLNYDVSATRSSAASGDTRELGALTEAGFTSALGVLTSSYIGRNLAAADPATPSAWRRLETTFTRDFPADNVTLRLGDSSTRSSLSGRSVYFGGFQLAKNFALTPGFVTQPIPAIAGVSRTPSTLALYVNDALRQTSQVPAGPFAIENFPLLTGAGEARVVLRDLLGRETVVTQRFFTDPTLLAQGLSDWSMEAGAVRRDLSIENAEYGARFVSGVVRHGVTPALTIEGQTQLSKGLQNAGLGFNFGLPFEALGQTAIATSRNDNGERGYEWVVGTEQRNLRHGYSIRAQSASRDYRQLGLEADVLPQRLALSAAYSYMSDAFGSLGLGLARIQSYNDTVFTTYSANYSMRIGARSSLSFNATRVVGSTSGSSVGVSLIVPLDGHVISSSSVSSKSGQLEGYSSVSKGLTTEIGMGWRTLAGMRGNAPYSEGGVYYQGGKGLLTADVSVASAQQTARVGAQGGLVFVERQLFASRPLEDSFALVQVAGYPNVGVGFQSSTLTRTDSEGLALLPRLLPYQRNSIRLDPAELPISAEIDNIEQIAVPAGRSGVKIVFPVRAGRGALIKIVLDDGTPAPAGAQIELIGDDKEFFVARRGEAFITGLNMENRLRLKWAGATCTFAVTLPPGKIDDISRVGPVICSGIVGQERR